jgi:hypothetical protein
MPLLARLTWLGYFSQKEGIYLDKTVIMKGCGHII